MQQYICDNQKDLTMAWAESVNWSNYYMPSSSQAMSGIKNLTTKYGPSASSA